MAGTTMVERPPLLAQFLSCGCIPRPIFVCRAALPSARSPAEQRQRSIRKLALAAAHLFSRPVTVTVLMCMSDACPLP